MVNSGCIPAGTVNRIRLRVLSQKTATCQGAQSGNRMLRDSNSLFLYARIDKPAIRATLLVD